MKTARSSLLILAVVVAASAFVWADTASPAPAGAKMMVNIQLSNASVVDGIRALFQDTNFNYTVEPGVKGKIVEMTLKGVTFDQALKAFTEAAGLTYVVDEEGTYIIGPGKAAGATRAVARASKPVPVTDQSSTTQTVSDIPDGQGVDTPQTDQTGMSLGDLQSTLVPPAQVNPYTYQIAPGVNFAPSNLGGVYYGPGGIRVVNGDGYYPPFTVGGAGFGGYGYGYGWPGYAIGGGIPYVMGYTMGPPPPDGWVNPEMQRLWRAQYAAQLRPYFVTPY